MFRCENGAFVGKTRDSIVDSHGRDRDRDRGDTPCRIDYLSESRIVVARFCGSFDTDGAWQRLEIIGKEVSCRVVEGALLDVRARIGPRLRRVQKTEYQAARA
jgi:hypothetical protein